MRGGKKRSGLLKCAKCASNVTRTQHKIQCASNCNGWFHKSCSGLTNEEFTAYELCKTDEKWCCVECSIVHASGDVSDSEPEITPLPRRSMLIARVDQVGSFRDILEHPNPSNKEIMRAIRGVFEDLKKSVTFNGNVMEEMKDSLNKLASENKSLKKEQQQLKSRVIDLESEIMYIKGSMNKSIVTERTKNIVIVGLTGDDNASSDVKKVFSALDVDIPTSDYNVKPLPSQQDRKPILVSFSQENMKEKVLKQRKLIPLDTNKCGIRTDVNRRIYINQDLSKHTRELFRKAMELRDIGFKYVWCRDETVLARRTDGGPVIQIITSAQIDGLKTEK